MRRSGNFASDALAELGYTTRLVDSATEALEELAAGADRFDVVFTDVVMPGMTGIELAQEVRRRYADLPVLLTSGYSHVLSEHGSYGFELCKNPIPSSSSRACCNGSAAENSNRRRQSRHHEAALAGALRPRLPGLKAPGNHRGTF